MGFKNLKLGKKLMVAFGIILAIMAIANVFTIRKMQTIQAGIDEVSTNWLPRAIAISDISRSTADLRINQLQHALTTDATIRQIQAQTMIALIDNINKNLDTYERLKTESEEHKLYSKEEDKLYKSFDEYWEAYQDISFTFFALTRENKNNEAVKLLNGEALKIFDVFSAYLTALVNVNQKDSEAAAARAEKTYKATRKVSLLLTFGTIVLSIFLILGLVKIITVPVLELENAAGQIAEGDLDVKLYVQSQDEIGNLAKSFNKMALALKEARGKMEKQAQTLRAQNRELERAMRELRQTQEQLLLKEKMASLGNLVAGVTHEINNPIGTVNAAADVSERCLRILEKIIKKSTSLDQIKNNDEFKRVYKILQDNINVTSLASDRIITIVKSLKNFARLDESEYQKADIHEGLDSSLTLLNNELKDRIQVKKDYGDIPNIICYPGQLNQVFLNLIKNAISAIENSGVVGIKTFKENNHIHIEICDTGKGIPGNKLNKIFDFHFTAGGARIKMSSGLSTAYNIIQKHDGEIKINSEVGKGTRVSIMLPIKAAGQAIPKIQILNAK